MRCATAIGGNHFKGKAPQALCAWCHHDLGLKAAARVGRTFRGAGLHAGHASERREPPAGA